MRTVTARRLLRAAGRWGVSLAVLVVVALALRGRVDDAVGTGVPWPSPLAVVAAVAASVAANEALVRCWLGLVRLGGADLPLARARWVWTTTQLARYAVGMAQVASRGVVARRHGLSATAGVVTTLLEVVWYIAVNAAVALATVPWWLTDELWWVAAVAVLPGVVLLAALVAPAAFVRLAVALGRLPVVDRVAGGATAALGAITVRRGQTAALTGGYVLNFALRLLGFAVLFAALGGDLARDGLAMTGAFAVGHLVGAVVVIAPGGVGPREGVTALVLAPVLGAAPVLMLVAANRVAELVAELVLTGLARLGWPAGGRRTPADADAPAAGPASEPPQVDASPPRE